MKENKKIQTVIFDIGNVLMTFNFMPYINRLLKDETVIGRVIDALWGTGYWNQLDLGEKPEEVFSRMIQAQPHYEKEIRKTLDHVGECMDRKDYAIPWIKELKERGFQVLYLSNYSEFIMDARREVLDFLPYMDGGIFSCHEGLIKPDPEIFRLLCERYSLHPKECVFIDDNADNIKAAKTFGLNAIQFTGYEKTRALLEKILE